MSPTNKEASKMDTKTDRAIAEAATPHNTDGDKCWCEPDIEYIDGTKIIIHREVH